MTTPEVHLEQGQEERIYCHRRNCPGSTGLRCYQTNVPICMQCAVRTPVGYISKDAQKERQSQYFNIENTDYLLVAVVGFIGTLVIGLPAVMFLSFLGIWGLFIAAIAGSAIGGGIGEATFRAIRRRRGRHTHQILIGSMAFACMLLLCPSLSIGGLFGPVILGIFGFTSIGAAVARIRVAL